MELLAQGKSKHRTTWEDQGLAGFECDGKDAGTVDTEWSVCGICGQDVRLSWTVYIMDRRARTAPKEKK